jgi:hypothetical protein
LNYVIRWQAACANKSSRARETRSHLSGCNSFARDLLLNRSNNAGRSNYPSERRNESVAYVARLYKCAIRTTLAALSCGAVITIAVRAGAAMKARYGEKYD